MKAALGVHLLAAHQAAKALVKMAELSWLRLGAFYRGLAGQVNVAAGFAPLWWPVWICVVGVLMLFKIVRARVGAAFRHKQ
jgi:hypothetical protein